MFLMNFSPAVNTKLSVSTQVSSGCFRVCIILAWSEYFMWVHNLATHCTLGPKKDKAQNKTFLFWIIIEFVYQKNLIQHKILKHIQIFGLPCRVRESN